MFVLLLMLAAPDPSAWTNHSQITQVFEESHMAFGCRPNEELCPTWDCAVTQSGVDCEEFGKLEDPSTRSMTWVLCYDRGFQRYLYKTQMCHAGECCKCLAMRLKDERSATVCSDCHPCCMECYEEL